GQVLDGVDRKRSFGAILHWPEKGSVPTSLDLPVVYFVPIADEKLFLKMLERLHCRPRKADKGLYRLTIPGLPDLFLRFAHRYAFASTQQALVQGQLTDPATLVPAGRQQAALAVRLFVERIPRAEFERQVAEFLAVVRRAIGEELGPGMPVG